MRCASPSPWWAVLVEYQGACEFTKTHGVTVRSTAARSAFSQLYWSLPLPKGW